MAADHVEFRSIEAGHVPEPCGRPAALLVPSSLLSRWDAPALAVAVDQGLSLILLVDDADPDLPPDFPDHLFTAIVTPSGGPLPLAVALRTALRKADDRRHINDARAERAALAREVTDLTETGIRLLTEREHSVLLELILSQARRLTAADAASLYLVENSGQAPPRLVFKLTQNESRPDIQLASFALPIDSTSLAGHAARSGQPVVIDDVYQLPDGLPFGFNRSIDDESGYRTKSVLVIPMPDQAGSIIGVLQLINRKPPDCRVFRDAEDVAARALPFDARTVGLARALAGQAAVSIENAQLHSSIEQLFEGFVLATVKAIEQRDPATSGHSERVAVMTCALAEAVHRDQSEAFRAVRFSGRELRALRYAALLHDVGKLGVREQVLVKARKLYPGQLHAIELRHALLRRGAEWRYQRELNRFLYERGREGFDEAEAALRDLLRREQMRLDSCLAKVRHANEPTVLPAEEAAGLNELLEPEFEGPDGALTAFLTPDEVAALRVRQGSLNDAEWEEIRHHAVWTWEFLNRIPWTPELEDVPQLARGHHEKLDGSGYPLGVAGEAIPFLTRMMTIADIYDALSAADRPYKRAVPPARALEILLDEVRLGRLDGDLVQLFIDARIHERLPPEAPVRSQPDADVLPA